MSNYPPSLDPTDSACPWNQPDEDATCRGCGDPCDSEEGICEDCAYHERMDIAVDYMRDQELFN